MTEMKTIPVGVLHNPDEVKEWLAKAGTQHPTLHPRINSTGWRDQWNGWNNTVCIGRDATGAFVEVEQWHFGSGHSDYSVKIKPGRRLLSTGALDLITYPVELTEAMSVINHPEHTPVAVTHG
jgi:hypothetical protein